MNSILLPLHKQKCGLINLCIVLVQKILGRTTNSVSTVDKTTLNLRE